MAITFPRPLYNIQYHRALMYLDDGVKSAMVRRRRMNYTKTEEARWFVDLTTRPMTYAEFEQFDAWYMSLRGGLKAVMFIHPIFPYPVAHRKLNRAAAEDNGVVDSVANSNEITISGVSAALNLTVGDRFSIVSGTERFMCKITEVTTNTTTTRQLVVEPPIPVAFRTAGLVVKFANADLKMRLVPNSRKEDMENGLYSVSFTLIEASTI